MLSSDFDGGIDHFRQLNGLGIRVLGRKIGFLPVLCLLNGTGVLLLMLLILF